LLYQNSRTAQYISSLLTFLINHNPYEDGLTYHFITCANFAHLPNVHQHVLARPPSKT